MPMEHERFQEMARACEHVEARAFTDLYRALPPGLAAALGARIEYCGSATVLLATNLANRLFNRVLSLGIGEVATEEQLDTILHLYQGSSIPFSIQLSPFAQPPGLADWLERRGLTVRFHAAKLYHEVVRASEVPTDLRIEHIGPAFAHIWAEVAGTIFTLPEPVRQWLAALVGRPCWQHYLAFDGAKPVATGLLYIHDGLGWLGWGATLASHRRRGAQRAVFARRICDAAELGCRWLTAETRPNSLEQPNPSYHNALRSGFRLAYLRPAYLYSKEQTP